MEIRISKRERHLVTLFKKAYPELHGNKSDQEVVLYIRFQKDLKKEIDSKFNL